MSTLREAAQQALEALEKVNWSAAQDWHEAFDDEISALRAALAQQAEPVAWEGWWLHHGQHNYRAKPLTSERVKELMKLAFEVGREAALAQQAEPGEPVAWLSRDDARLALWEAINKREFGNPTDDKLILDHLHQQGLWIGKYTAPPQQAEPVDTDCHTQGICQRSGYGIGKQADPQIEDRLARHGIPKP